MTSRPTETIVTTVGGIITAVFLVLAAQGVKLPAALPGALIGLVTALAPVITYFVAKRQRSGTSASAADGKVTPA